MKLGEGGEAFFVFETSEQIPESLQTSPVVSPAASPHRMAQDATVVPSLQEPDFLDITANGPSIQHPNTKASPASRPGLTLEHRAQSDYVLPDGRFSQAHRVAVSEADEHDGLPPNARPTASPVLPEIQLKRSASADAVPLATRLQSVELHSLRNNEIPPPQPSHQMLLGSDTPDGTKRSGSPTPLSTVEAIDRAKSLSKKLSTSNISSRVTDSGDLMLDMTGYKTSEEKALRAESIARKILAEELEGNYNIGALIGADMQGNLWIYSSEEAKEAAQQQLQARNSTTEPIVSDAASDPGYQSDDEPSTTAASSPTKHQRTRSEDPPTELTTPADTPPTSATSSGDLNRNYAKTLRLTSDQLKAMDLKPGPNVMSFSVNRATCSASMYYWTYDVPIVISDIDGTITKCVRCRNPLGKKLTASV